MNGRTIEASIDAWLPSHASYTPADFATTDPLTLINAFGYSTHDMAPDWLKIGTARITVEIKNVDALIDQQISALQEARTKVLADAQMKATEINRRIQSMLALTNDVGSAA